MKEIEKQIADIKTSPKTPSESEESLASQQIRLPESQSCCASPQVRQVKEVKSAVSSLAEGKSARSKESGMTGLSGNRDIFSNPRLT